MTTLNTVQLSLFDHVGSFLRPQTLKKAREQYLKQEITYDALK